MRIYAIGVRNFTNDRGQQAGLVVPPILPQPSCRDQQHPGNSSSRDITDHTVGHFGHPMRGCGRWVITGGMAAVPVLPGLAWLWTGRPDRWPLLAIASGILLVTAALNAAVAIYQARQVTQRQQIKQHGVDVLADALAQCMNDTHIAAQRNSGISRSETAQIRADASRTLASMLPAVLALVNGQPKDSH